MNGDRVTWGSDDQLSGTGLRVRELEELAEQIKNSLLEEIAGFLDSEAKMRRIPFSDHFLREEMAAQQHEIWAHWMRYLFSVAEKQPRGGYLIPTKTAKRWQRQMEKAYSDLPAKEQDSDREQADKIMALLFEKCPECVLPQPKEPDDKPCDNYLKHARSRWDAATNHSVDGKESAAFEHLRASLGDLLSYIEQQLSTSIPNP
jgi:hypothetical protein